MLQQKLCNTCEQDVSGGCTEHVGKGHSISMFSSPSILCGLSVTDWGLALHASPMKYELSAYLGVQEFLTLAF